MNTYFTSTLLSSQNIYAFFSQINYIVLFFIFFSHFVFQAKEKNFFPFPNILFNIFKIKYLYRYIKYSVLAHYLTLIVCLMHVYASGTVYVNNVLSKSLIENPRNNYSQYIICLFVLTTFTFLLKKNKIIKYINSEVNLRYRKEKYSFLKYIIFCFTSYFVMYLFLSITNILFDLIDYSLVSQAYLPFESYSKYNTGDSYKRGVFLSVYLASGYVIILFNSIMKNYNRRYTLEDILMYVFVLIIVAFGVFSGVYSVINFLVNESMYGLQSEWLNTDKLIGNYSVRITSILLLWNITKFVYISVFKEKFFSQLIVGLLPIDPNISEHNKNLGELTSNRTNFFDIIFFTQVAFYILNVFTAEFLVSNANIDRLSNFLTLLLPIMVDDFFAIHVYHKRYNYIDRWHSIKISMFNALLFISSIFALWSDSHFSFLVIYIATSLFIYAIYKSKAKHYN